MRRQDRTEIVVPVQLTWTDRLGHDNFATGQSLDINDWGIRVQISVPLIERTYVSLRADQLSLAGRASVRTCRKLGAKYLVGLEFSGGLKWKLPRKHQQSSGQSAVAI